MSNLSEICLLSFIDENTRKRIAEYFFYIYVFLMSFAKAIGLDRTDKAYYVIGMVAGVAALISIMFIGFTILEYSMLFASGILIACVFYFSHQLAPVCLYLLFWICKRADLKKTMKGLLVVWIVGFASVVLLSTVGIIPNRVRFDEIHGGVYRYAMGYKKDNTFHIVLFIITLLWGYIVEKKKIWMYAFFLTMDFVAYKLSDSRAGFLLTALVVLTWGGLEYVKKKQKCCRIVNAFLDYTWFVPALFSLIAIIARNTDAYLWNALNQVTNNRLLGIQVYYNDLMPRILGQVVDTKTYNGYMLVLDNAYAYMLLQYGIIYAIVFITLYVVFFTSLTQEYIPEKIVAWFMLLYGLVEQFIQNCFMNFSLVIIASCIWMVIYNKKKKDY